MLTILCLLFMVGIFGKLIGVAIKMTWGITKIIFTLIFLPLIILVFIIAGLFYIAIPILAIIGLVTLISSIA